MIEFQLATQTSTDWGDLISSKSKQTKLHLYIGWVLPVFLFLQWQNFLFFDCFYQICFSGDLYYCNFHECVENL